METVLFALFGIGVGYAVLTAIVGDLFGLELHAGELPFLSPTIIATFLTVFGGIGYTLMHNTGWHALPVTGAALLAAICVSSLVLFLVIVPLHAAQKGAALSAKMMVGLQAKVITTISSKRMGEIVYEQGGTRHSAPAKSKSEDSIPHGSEVRIVDEMAGMFVVERL